MSSSSTTSTAAPQVGEIPIQTVIIITASLGGAVIVLAIILICIFYRRNMVKRDINSSVKSTTSPAVISGINTRAAENPVFTIADETPERPIAAPRKQSDRESTGSAYVDMNGAQRASPCERNKGGQQLRLDTPIKAPAQADTTNNPDYVNSTAA